MGLLVQGLERASQAFFHDGFLRVIKGESPLVQEWPAQIFDPGLFCACQAHSETVYAIPIFQEQGG